MFKEGDVFYSKFRGPETHYQIIWIRGREFKWKIIKGRINDKETISAYEPEHYVSVAIRTEEDLIHFLERKYCSG